jgi:signal transduction histidine kinase
MSNNRNLRADYNPLNTKVISGTYNRISFYAAWLLIALFISKFFTDTPIYVAISFLIVGLLSFYLSKLFSRNKDSKSINENSALLIFSYIFLIVIDFIFNGGIYSPSIYFLFPIVIIIRFLTVNKYKALYTFIVFFIYTTLTFIQFFFPQYIIERHPEVGYFNLERTSSLLISLSFMGFLIRNILNQYVYSKKRAMKSEKVKSEFLEIMSHMIRTPLNSINGFGDLLLDDDFVQEQKRDFVKRMIKNAETLNYLIRDLSDLAIIQTQALKLYPTTFQIKLLVSEIEEKALQLLKTTHHKIDFITDVSDADKNISVYTDYQRISQVLWHIIVNGIKFTKKGGVTLKIVNNTETNHIHFCITDTGIGMTEKEQDQLFLLINKQNAGFNIQDEGTGLGLNIAQGILENMNGSIDIRSQKNIGTKVTIKIPNRIII